MSAGVEVLEKGERCKLWEGIKASAGVEVEKRVKRCKLVEIVKVSAGEEKARRKCRKRKTAWKRGWGEKQVRYKQQKCNREEVWI